SFADGITDVNDSVPLGVPDERAVLVVGAADGSIGDLFDTVERLERVGLKLLGGHRGAGLVFRQGIGGGLPVAADLGTRRGNRGEPDSARGFPGVRGRRKFDADQEDTDVRLLEVWE